MLRVLLATGVYPPDIGGPAAQTEQIAQGLLRRGHAVRVVTWGDPTDSGEVAGVPVTRLAQGQRGGRGKLGRALDVGQRKLRLLRDIERVVAEFRPDLLQAQVADANLALLVGLVARRRGLPSVVKYTADIAFEMTNQAALVQRPTEKGAEGGGARALMLEKVEQAVFHLHRGVWATTPTFAERLQQAFGLPAERILTYPNFIVLDAFEAVGDARRDAETPEPFRLLTVTRLKPWKGVDLAIEAMTRLSDLPLQLTVVGSGDPAYEAQLQSLAQERGVADRVHFAGRVAPSDVARCYAEADAFLMPSQYEPFGIVLVEAMAAGLPIVTTGAGGIPYVVDDGRCARMVAAGDPAALASGVRAVVEDPELREELRERGRRHATRFGVEAGVDALVGAWERLLRGEALAT